MGDISEGIRVEWSVGRGGSGVVIWVGPSKFGPGIRCGVRDEHSETHWLAASDLTVAPALAISIAVPELPTAAWTKRLEGGEFAFSTQGIHVVQSCLSLFLEHLDELPAPRQRSHAYARAKWLVEDINKANEHHGSFIDTQEREELVDWVCRTLTAYGVQVRDDITEPWRKW